jgi:hypothetical protein
MEHCLAMNVRSVGLEPPTLGLEVCRTGTPTGRSGWKTRLPSPKADEQGAPFSKLSPAAISGSCAVPGHGTRVAAFVLRPPGGLATSMM